MNIPPADATRHAELCRRIEVANHEYHNLARPSLTDAEYDALVKEVKAIEQRYPGLTPTVTAKVGAASPGAKVKHLRSMLSLDNVFTPEETRRFFKTDYELVWEPKIDGLSLSLIYAGGALVRAVTRGDGTTGDDVTHNAMVIPSIPNSIPIGDYVEVRGEVYISIQDFQFLTKAMVDEGDEPFSNARNAAAGSLKLRDSKEAAGRHLSFIAYHAFGLPNVRTQQELCAALHELDFGTTTPITIDSGNIDDTVMETVDDMRHKLPYETDGAVFKINDLKVREELGSGSKSPKWAVAYKFPPEQKTTKLLDVVLQVGRTGTINPVAILAPVELGGATVRRASLCNYDEIGRLGIAIGDEVIVVRAAEVIPKVLGVAKKTGNQPILPPTQCPCCGGRLFREHGVVAYRCVNHGCKDQAEQRIAHAVCKSCLDWDGFGAAQVKEFVDHGFTTLSSIIASDPSWLKSAARRKFLAERERIKVSPLWRKLHALGLDLIGKSFCQDLAFKYGSLLKLVDDPSGVMQIVGPNRAERMFQQLDEMADEIGSLDTLGYHFEEVKKDTPKTDATGKVFVITGTLITGTREDVAAKIEQAGGVVKGSVTKATSYLVVGDSPGGNKTAAAAKHGTPTIGEEELYALIGADFKVASNPLDKVNLDDL